MDFTPKIYILLFIQYLFLYFKNILFTVNHSKKLTFRILNTTSQFT